MIKHCQTEKRKKIEKNFFEVILYIEYEKETFRHGLKQSNRVFFGSTLEINRKHVYIVWSETVRVKAHQP